VMGERQWRKACSATCTSWASARAAALPMAARVCQKYSPGEIWRLIIAELREVRTAPDGR